MVCLISGLMPLQFLFVLWYIYIYFPISERCEDFLSCRYSEISTICRKYWCCLIHRDRYQPVFCYKDSSLSVSWKIFLHCYFSSLHFITSFIMELLLAIYQILQLVLYFIYFLMCHLLSILLSIIGDIHNLSGFLLLFLLLFILFQLVYIYETWLIIQLINKIQNELLKYLIGNKNNFLPSVPINVFANFRLDFTDDQWYNLFLNVQYFRNNLYVRIFKPHYKEKLYVRFTNEEGILWQKYFRNVISFHTLYRYSQLRL